MKTDGLIQRAYKAIVSICIILAMLLVGVRIIGYTPYVILSSSMTPQYNIGDLVYIRKIKPEKLKNGDVITFIANENGVLVTHRIAKISEDYKQFYTKGDANIDEDVNPVDSENIVGKVGFSLPLLGYVSTYLTSKTGRYVCLFVIFILFFFVLLPSPKKKEKEIDNGK